MENNIFMQIDQVNKKVNNKIIIPPLITETNEPMNNIHSNDNLGLRPTSSSSHVNIPSSSYSSSYLPSSLSSTFTKEDFPFSLAITSADTNAINSSIFTSTFIEYSVLIVRNSDGESKIVKKRYKDLLNYYQQLVSNEIITNHDDIIFPERNSFAPADPNTPFIKKRMLDLQIFFQKLFNQNPQLYLLPLTIEFFEIENIVLNSNGIKNRILSKETTMRAKQYTSTKQYPSYNSPSYDNSSIFSSITTFNSNFVDKQISSFVNEQKLVVTETSKKIDL